MHIGEVDVMDTLDDLAIGDEFEDHVQRESSIIFADEDTPIVDMPHIRQYQRELVDHCKDENTIIVAPTGAGKTIIAALLIRETLDVDSSKKVLFLVNQVSLVEQQAITFREFGIQRVGTFYGEGKSLMDWDIESKTYDVMVCTIQMLLNALRKNTEILEDIQLIVFDECHHTHSNHPYKVLMKNFYKPRKFSGKAIPRVIGLTASPAAKNTLGETVLKLLQLCHDMDCTVRRVEQHEEELRQYVHIPNVQKITVNMDRHGENLRNYLYSAVKRVKIQLLEKCAKDIHGDIDVDDEKFGTDEADEWINKKNKAQRVSQNDGEEDGLHLSEFLQTLDKQKSTLTLLCQTLSILNECLIINDHRSPSAA